MDIIHIIQMNVKNVFTLDLHVYTEYQHFLIQNALERSLFKTYTFRVTKRCCPIKYTYLLYIQEPALKYCV